MKISGIHIVIAAVFTVTCLALSGQGHAQNSQKDIFAKERFQLRLRGIGILPESGGELNALPGDPEADDRFVPEFDVTYFLTDKVALELIAATARHDVKQKEISGGNDLDLGATNILPATLTAQYHFQPNSDFAPYVGAGINYTHPFNEDDGQDTNALEAHGNFGYALQAGADYWFNKHWGINFDVKKVYVELDVESNGPATRGDAELDPWVIGTGIAYRF